jgi:hypothetical protein
MAAVPYSGFSVLKINFHRKWYYATLSLEGKIRTAKDLVTNFDKRNNDDVCLYVRTSYRKKQSEPIT